MTRKELYENKLQMDYPLNSTSFEDTSRRAISIARDSHIRKKALWFLLTISLKSQLNLKTLILNDHLIYRCISEHPCKFMDVFLLAIDKKEKTRWSSLRGN